MATVAQEMQDVDQAQVVAEVAQTVQEQVALAVTVAALEQAEVAEPRRPAGLAWAPPRLALAEVPRGQAVLRGQAVPVPALREPRAEAGRLAFAAERGPPRSGPPRRREAPVRSPRAKASPEPRWGRA